MHAEFFIAPDGLNKHNTPDSGDKIARERERPDTETERGGLEKRPRNP